MLNNTIKNLLSIILVLCILLQGCKSPQTTTPPPETITPKISVQEQPELKEIVFSHLKELSKEELEQEIQECEEYFSHQYDFDQDKSPEEQLALIGGIIFSPFIHVYYIQAKFEYIEKYGTRKQQQALKESKTSSGWSQRQFHDLMKILDMHPNLYDFYGSQPDLHDSLAPEIESQKELQLRIKENLEDRLKDIYK